MIVDFINILLLLLVWLHVVVTPFTKVEESFNVQAMHDMMYLGTDLSSYDHHMFPGVVPRTFLGAAAVALPSKVIVKMLHALMPLSKLLGLYVVRAVLSLYWVLSVARFRQAVRTAYGSHVSTFLGVVYLCQFHLPFYASRPLPNTFATILTHVAFAWWLEAGAQPGAPAGPSSGPQGVEAGYRMQQRAMWAVLLLTFTATVIRCDVVLLLGLIGVHMLLTGMLPFGKAVATGLAAVAASVLLSVAFDSIFWRRWLWPEGQVLWFNTAENRSHEWGVLPWHWYWTSALPRALLGPLLLVPFGPLTDRRTLGPLLVALGFVALYSNLPHKEVRFLFPGLPLLNLVAAAALGRWYLNRGKSAVQRVLWLAAQGLLSASFVLAVVFTYVSSLNYPGGSALVKLHAQVAPDLVGSTGLLLKHAPGSSLDLWCPSSALVVHVGVLAAMTGVSRFGELSHCWQYSKDESLSTQDYQHHNFSHLLSASAEVPGFVALDQVLGHPVLRLAALSPDSLLSTLGSGVPPVQVQLSPALYLLARAGTDAG